jgi:hypothetical protein
LAEDCLLSTLSNIPSCESTYGRTGTARQDFSSRYCGGHRHGDGSMSALIAPSLRPAQCASKSSRETHRRTIPAFSRCAIRFLAPLLEIAYCNAISVTENRQECVEKNPTISAVTRSVGIGEGAAAQ